MIPNGQVSRNHFRATCGDLGIESTARSFILELEGEYIPSEVGQRI